MQNKSEQRLNISETGFNKMQQLKKAKAWHQKGLRVGMISHHIGHQGLLILKIIGDTYPITSNSKMLMKCLRSGCLKTFVASANDLQTGMKCPCCHGKAKL